MTPQDEWRVRAAKKRRDKTRRVILDHADTIADSGELATATLVGFAKSAGVSHNSVRKHFGDMNGVIAELVKERKASGKVVSASLSRTASAGGTRDPLDSVLEVHRRMSKLEERDLSAAEEIHAETVARGDHHAVACACCHLAKLYLNYSSRKLLMDKAIQTVDDGLGRLDLLNGRSHAALEGQLARIGATAARRASLIVGCPPTSAAPSEPETSLMRLAAVKYLTKIVAYKDREHRVAERLDLPVEAASAEFHRDRAAALLQMEDSPALEVESARNFARRLVNLYDQKFTAEPRTLATLLTRVCALRIAYPDLMDADDQLLTDAEALITIFKNQDDLDGRAILTMFALSDPNHNHDNDIHQSDLSLVTTFGVVGRLLVADHLRKTAYAKKQDQSELRTDSAMEKLISPGLDRVADLSTQQLFAAALMYYDEAPRHALVLGAAHILATRARDSYARLSGEGVPRAAEWPVFKDGHLDIAQTNFLSLGVVTGRRPNQAQARQLLREMRPFLTVLELLAMPEIKARDRVATEDPELPRFRYY
jgi:hypothetical protein